MRRQAFVWTKRVAGQRATGQVVQLSRRHRHGHIEAAIMTPRHVRIVGWFAVSLWMLEDKRTIFSSRTSTDAADDVSYCEYSVLLRPSHDEKRSSMALGIEAQALSSLIVGEEGWFSSQFGPFRTEMLAQAVTECHGVRAYA